MVVDHKNLCSAARSEGPAGKHEHDEQLPIDTRAKESIMQLPLPPDIMLSVIAHEEELTCVQSSKMFCRDIRLTVQNRSEVYGKLKPKHVFLKNEERSVCREGHADGTRQGVPPASLAARRLFNSHCSKTAPNPDWRRLFYAMRQRCC